MSLPAGVKVQGAIKGGVRSGPRLGSGAGYVDVGLRLSAGAPTTIVLPAGLTMVSKQADVQHGLLVQEVRIMVPAQGTQQWVLSLYCANQSRRPADETAEFKMGPVIEDPALADLFELLAGKDIVGDSTNTVQGAVWEITDGEGLTPETRWTLAALPARA